MQAGIQSLNIKEAEDILNAARDLLDEKPWSLDLASGRLLSVFWQQRLPSPPTIVASITYQELTDRYRFQYSPV